MLGLIFLVWFIPLVLLMMWITKKVYQQFETKWIKRTMGSLTGLFFIAVLWGDTIAGHLYLNYLCTTQGGPHVYQTVELGPEYWNEDGSAKFIYPNGTIVGGKFVSGEFNEMIRHRINKEWYEKRQEFKFGIVQYGLKIKEMRVLGEYIFFKYIGGWLSRTIGYNVSHSSCGMPMKFELFQSNVIINNN